jgi:hypothetical protein
LFALNEEVAKQKRGGVVGESRKNGELEGQLTVAVPFGLKLLVAVEMLAELEELAVSHGVKIGRGVYPGVTGGTAA